MRLCLHSPITYGTGIMITRLFGGGGGWTKSVSAADVVESQESVCGVNISASIGVAIGVVLFLPYCLPLFHHDPDLSLIFRLCLIWKNSVSCFRHIQLCTVSHEIESVFLDITINLCRNIQSIYLRLLAKFNKTDSKHLNPESYMGETLYVLITIVPILHGYQLDSPELSGDHQQDNE